MKTIFRNLALGILMAGISVVGATATFAQDDPCTADIEAKQALYKQFTDNFDKKEIEKKKIAVTSGKQYVEKYAACADDKAIVDYINGQVPSLEKDIARIQAGVEKQAIITRFNTAAQGKNVADIFTSGKELLVKQPDLIDVNITLASAGFEQTLTTPTAKTYNDETIAQAKTAIQQIEAGKKSEDYGVFTYSCDKKKFTDCKSYTLGAMNYAIGYILSYRQDKKKDALPYFYKATQYNSFAKGDPTVYQAIGAWYLDEAIKIDTVRQEKLKANENKDTEETLAMVGLQKGYADRSIDAYARAYKLAKADTNQTKQYTDGLYTRLKELYAFRYDGKTDGIDAFVSTVQNKPLPDPATEVTPVKEETPATTTTTSTTNTTTTPTKPTTPATNPVKPATTTPTKPVSQTTTTGTEKTATNTKAKTVKPTPKKKGTR